MWVSFPNSLRPWDPLKSRCCCKNISIHVHRFHDRCKGFTFHSHQNHQFLQEVKKRKLETIYRNKLTNPQRVPLVNRNSIRKTNLIPHNRTIRNNVVHNKKCHHFGSLSRVNVWNLTYLSHIWIGRGVWLGFSEEMDITSSLKYILWWKTQVLKESRKGLRVRFNLVNYET